MRASGLDIEFVRMTDLSDNATLATLLKSDSILGPLDADVSATEDAIVVDGNETRRIAERDPANIPWKDLDVDVVIESTGFFTNATKARRRRLHGGRRR